MSDQQLHDDIENIVIALKNIIPLLQNMGDTASDTIDKRLDNSLYNVDVKIMDLSHAITQLNESVASNQQFIISAERQALTHLKQGIERLVSTDVNTEYSHQISQVIARLEPIIESKVNKAIDELIDYKKLSISNHNDRVKDINDKLENNMNTIHETLLETIDKMSKASTAASTKFDNDLIEIKKVADAHTIALKGVEKSTATTVKKIETTLTNVKRSAVLMAQSPATMTAATAGFFALCLMVSIVYVYKLWTPFFISAGVIGVILGGIWGFMAWLDSKQ